MIISEEQKRIIEQIAKESTENKESVIAFGAELYHAGRIKGAMSTLSLVIAGALGTFGLEVLYYKFKFKKKD